MSIAVIIDKVVELIDMNGKVDVFYMPIV